jgi:hypothetical protein
MSGGTRRSGAAVGCQQKAAAKVCSSIWGPAPTERSRGHSKSATCSWPQVVTRRAGILATVFIEAGAVSTAHGRAWRANMAAE